MGFRGKAKDWDQLGCMDDEGKAWPEIVSAVTRKREWIWDEDLDFGGAGFGMKIQIQNERRKGANPDLDLI